jgi:hypothetical protein
MNKNKNIQFSLQENISNNVILIDGITRCGKSIFSNIIPTFENVEQLQFFNLLEHIVPAMSLSAISDNFAMSLIRTNMNELAYNRLISRNANFRIDDQTSVLNHMNAKEYFARLSRKEGDEVTAELRQKKQHFPFMSHDIVSNLSFFEKLNMNYKIIHIFRNPIDLAYSWFTRGWGDRFQNDPRSFTLSINYNNNTLPWYCNNIEEEYLQSNPMEKCILIIINLYKNTITELRNSKCNDKILNISFENFVQKPYTDVTRISNFLNLKTTYKTESALHQANCPRKISIFDFEEKYIKIKNNCNKNLFEQLIEIQDNYEIFLNEFNCI